MKHQVAQACIAANYQYAFDRLNVVPTGLLQEEAELSSNKYYAEELERRIGPEPRSDRENWNTCVRDKEPSSCHLADSISASCVHVDCDYGIYGVRGGQVYVKPVILYVCASERLRKKARKGGGLVLPYPEESSGNSDEDEEG